VLCLAYCGFLTSVFSIVPFQQPYFFSQDPDYITVKERVAALCASGTEATGIATIDIAVETLRVAEYLTPTLQEQLK
jgi:hypothetical protein